jgi:hypothetical protein
MELAMGLFDQILGAVAGGAGQQNSEMGAIMNVVSQLSGTHGVDPSMMNGVLSAVAGQAQTALKGHSNPLQAVADLQGTEHNPASVDALFGGQQAQVAESVAQQTGLNASTVTAMLPTLLPVVMGMLHQGGGGQAQPGQAQGNPLLTAFLDSDHDGDTDISDILNLAGRFFK